MTTAFWMKVKVSLAIECFDAIYYKLLHINVNDIDQLVKEIHTSRLNTFPQNINELGIKQQSILKITILAGDAKRLSAVSYTIPLQKVFHMNATDNDKELNYSNAATDALQKDLMTASLTMKKLFPIKWTNEVSCKFLLINVNPSDVLLRHIMDGTLNLILKSNDFLSMNSTTLQVLVRATLRFNIRTGIERWSETTTWILRKKKRCFNYKIVG